MITDITLGQYFPGNSLLHKLDPRMKIILTTMYVVVLLVMKSAASCLFLTVCTVSIMIMSGIPMRMYVRSLKPLWFIIAFTGVFNILFSSSGEILAQFWIFKITGEGIATAVKLMLRIVLLIASSSVLTYTTSPILLSGGIERLLSPLKKIKVPVHDFSMMMTIALRFIPTLTDETSRIMSAQKARGADFETGSIFKRIKAVIPVIIPLFISSFRHAVELATAMQCRCYVGDVKGRTRFVKYSLHMRDWTSLIVLAVVIVCVVFLNRIRFGGYI